MGLHKKQKQQQGFTIVELLIVVVVIAILAAITIVSYNGITNRAKDSAVSSMASQVQKKLALYATTNNEQYPATLADAGVDAATSANVQYSYNNQSSPAGFCVTASQSGVSSYSAKTYTYTSAATQTIDQTTPTRGACPGHVAEGATATSNAITNPGVRAVTNGWSAVASTGGAQSGNRMTGITGLSALGITTAYRTSLGGTPASWWRVQNNSNTPVSEGKTYTLSGYIRPSVAASTGVIILWQNASNGVISESASTFNPQTNMTWERKSVTATAPAGAVTARFHFGATNNGVSGAYLDATAAMFYEGSSLYSYADGDSSGWIWEGAANAATSKGPSL